MYALGVALHGPSEHDRRPDAEGEPQCTRVVPDCAAAHPAMRACMRRSMATWPIPTACLPRSTSHRFARWSHGRTSMHVPKHPLVDVASQLVGAEGPAGGGEAGSYSLQAEMKLFNHEALGAEEEPARDNVQNNPVMGEPTSASACRLSPCRHWRHSHHGWA
eukprot:423778-Karenia_brevis.AAC.1